MVFHPEFYTSYLCESYSLFLGITHAYMRWAGYQTYAFFPCLSFSLTYLLLQGFHLKTQKNRGNKYFSPLQNHNFSNRVGTQYMLNKRLMNKHQCKLKLHLFLRWAKRTHEYFQDRGTKKVGLKHVYGMSPHP